MLFGLSAFAVFGAIVAVVAVAVVAVFVFKVACRFTQAEIDQNVARHIGKSLLVIDQRGQIVELVADPLGDPVLPYGNHAFGRRWRGGTGKGLAHHKSKCF